MHKILFRIPALVLMKLLQPTEKEKTETWIHRETKITHSYVIKVIRDLVKLGLVVKERKGRKQELSLTKKGDIIANELKNVFDKLEVI